MASADVRGCGRPGSGGRRLRSSARYRSLRSNQRRRRLQALEWFGSSGGSGLELSEFYGGNPVEGRWPVAVFGPEVGSLTKQITRTVRAVQRS